MVLDDLELEIQGDTAPTQNLKLSVTIEDEKGEMLVLYSDGMPTDSSNTPIDIDDAQRTIANQLLASSIHFSINPTYLFLINTLCRQWYAITTSFQDIFRNHIF